MNLLPTTNYQLPTTNYQLPTTNYQLPTTSYQLPARVDYDSVNHVIGTPDYDAVQLTRINAYVSEATLSHAGKSFGAARREIAKDGMTMVITFQQDSQTRIHHVAYYVKVTP